MARHREVAGRRVCLFSSATFCCFYAWLDGPPEWWSRLRACSANGASDDCRARDGGKLGRASPRVPSPEPRHDRSMAGFCYTQKGQDAERLGISRYCGEVPKLGEPSDRTACQEEIGKYSSIIGNARCTASKTAWQITEGTAREIALSVRPGSQRPHDRHGRARPHHGDFVGAIIKRDQSRISHRPGRNLAIGFHYHRQRPLPPGGRWLRDLVALPPEKRSAPCSRTSAKKSASAFAMWRNASGCREPPCSRNISKWSGAGSLWSAAMSLRNDCPGSPSRSRNATGRKDRSSVALVPREAPPERPLSAGLWPAIARGWRRCELGHPAVGANSCRSDLRLWKAEIAGRCPRRAQQAQQCRGRRAGQPVAGATTRTCPRMFRLRPWAGLALAAA